jgi:apolipoprotein N-acyltransferase
MNAVRRHRALLLAVAGGVAFALTSPPTDLYPAVLLGLALLAASLTVPPAPRRGQPEGPPAPLGFWRAFGRGAAWGTAAGVVGLRFVPAVIQRFTDLGTPASLLALVLLAAGQSLVWALGAGLAAVAQRRARMPFELAFALGIFLACSLPAIFAWTPAGLVSPWPSFVQLADVLGERGLSAVFAAAAALVVRSALALYGKSPDPAAPSPPFGPARFTWKALRPAAAAVGIFAILALYGAASIRSITERSQEMPTARIGLVDQAILPRERWDPNNAPDILRKLRDLTHDVEAQGAELTVWPEAAYPYPLEHDAKAVPRGPLSPIGGKVHGPLLMGLITRDRPARAPDGRMEMNSFNSATLVAADGTVQPPYDKLQLLWFGEMVPLGAELPWLRRLFQRSGGLIPGTEARALVLPRDDGPPLKMAVLNCYEDTLAGAGRLVFNTIAPNLVVNVTNDAWFYDTAEPELHARLAAMRAVELRRDLVRSVNLGVASWIDAAGVVRARHAASAPGTLLVHPTLRDSSPMWYARVGDAPVQAAFALMIAFFAIRARRRAAARGAEAPSPPVTMGGSRSASRAPPPKPPDAPSPADPSAP